MSVSGALLAKGRRMAIVHYTQATRGRLAIARDESERRRLVSALAWTGGPRLLMFSLVDDHAHLALVGDRLGLLVRDLRWVVRRFRPDLQLDPAHVKPVESRSHLNWLLHYMLRQPEKHELAGVHPALFSGSCFQDLVGVRLLPGFDPKRLHAELPRLSLRDFFPDVGLVADPIAAATNEQLRRAGAARIAELAAASLGVGSEFRDRNEPTVRARALVARLSLLLRFAPREVSRYLQVGVRQVQRLAHDRSEDTDAERALRRRLVLEDRALGRIESRLGAADAR